jgi:hypothetical protein
VGNCSSRYGPQAALDQMGKGMRSGVKIFMSNFQVYNCLKTNLAKGFQLFKSFLIFKYYYKYI